VTHRNLLFDLDGTLVDSTPLHEWAYRQALQEYAPELLERFDYSSIAGWTTLHAFQQLGVAEPVDRVVKRKQALYREAVHAGRLEAFPGAREGLAAAARAGHRLYLVTSASRAGAEVALARSELSSFFEGTVTADDCQQGKPNPEPYLLCLSRYQLSAAESLAVEDSDGGASAARAAGLQVARVHSPGVPDNHLTLHQLFDSLLGRRSA